MPKKLKEFYGEIRDKLLLGSKIEPREALWGGDDMHRITPLNKRVLIEPEAKEEVTKGGIIIPDAANQKAPTKGRIIAIAEDSEFFLTSKILLGDLVLFSKFAGVEITVPPVVTAQKERHLQLIKDEDILGVIREEDSNC